MAATCKTFQDLRARHPMTHIAQFDPTDQVSYQGFFEPLPSLFELLRRATTDSDWIRCNFYAPGIRRLGFLPHAAESGCDDHIGQSKLDSSILEVLNINRILPFTNLRAL